MLHPEVLVLLQLITSMKSRDTWHYF